MILETEEQLYNAQCINKELSLGKEEWETKPDYMQLIWLITALYVIM